jgi:hypothetical protein
VEQWLVQARQKAKIDFPAVIPNKVTDEDVK